MKKRFLSLLISGILATSCTVPIFAEPLTEEQKKEIEIGTENLTKAEKELRNIEIQLTDVNTDIEVTKAEINSTQTKLDKKQKEIDSANVEIESLKGDVEVKSKALGGRLNSIYKAGGTDSYLQILLSSDSLSDFLGRVSAVNEIVGLDKKALEDVQSKQDQLDRKVTKLIKDKEDIKQLEIDNKKRVEDLKIKEVELQKLAQDYTGKYNSADTDLYESEKALYSYWETVIANGKTNIEDLKTTVQTLKDLKNTVKATKSKQAIDDLIARGENAIKNKEFAITSGIDVSNASDKAIELLAFAYKFKGYPYVWGAVGPNSFDCSGFTGYVFRHSGKELPRTTYEQQNSGVPVAYENLKPGDLILTRRSARGPEHVGIYVGNGQMIHASNPVDGVKVSAIYKFDRARRIL